MDLILWRHAEALDPEGDQSDLDRPLTPRGERQAARVAAWLGRRLPAGTRVLVSPARRTQQTASALDRKTRTVPGLAPGASVESLLQAAHWPDAREPVLIVGHQPTLGLTASYLLTGQLHPWPLRKGGVVWLRGRARDGVAQVLLQAAISPDLL